MGHYDEYYEEEYRKNRITQRERLEAVLKDLRAFGYYNAAGRSKNWTFGEIGLEKEYENLINKVKARLYDLT